MNGALAKASAPSRKRLGPGKWLLLAVAAWGLGLLAYALWPEGPLDLSREEEPFKSMVLPLKSIRGTASEGFPAEISIVDHAGASFRINFPYDHDGILNCHSTACYEPVTNSLSYADTGIFPVVWLKEPKRSKSMIVRLFKDYGGKNINGGRKDRAIVALSETEGLAGRCWKRLKGLFAP